MVSHLKCDSDVQMSTINNCYCLWANSRVWWRVCYCCCVPVISRKSIEVFEISTVNLIVSWHVFRYAMKTERDREERRCIHRFKSVYGLTKKSAKT